MPKMFKYIQFIEYPFINVLFVQTGQPNMEHTYFHRKIQCSSSLCPSIFFIFIYYIWKFDSIVKSASDIRSTRASHYIFFPTLTSIFLSSSWYDKNNSNTRSNEIVDRFFIEFILSFVVGWQFIDNNDG